MAHNLNMMMTTPMMNRQVRNIRTLNYALVFITLVDEKTVALRSIGKNRKQPEKPSQEPVT